jgi:hypothetical protein
VEQELNLGEAARALQTEHGDSLQAGLEQGKEIMVLTLQDRLRISRSEADKLVEALIQAHTVRWEGSTGNLPAEQTGVNPAVAARAEAGTWHF